MVRPTRPLLQCVNRIQLEPNSQRKLTPPNIHGLGKTMPYLLRTAGDTFQVVNKVTGAVEAAYTSHSKAVKDIRRRYAEENRGKVHPWLNINQNM